MSTQDTVAPPVKSLTELRQRRKALPPKNTYKQVVQNLSTMNKVALFITDRVGTFGFFLIIFAWTVIWLAWNTILPASQALRSGHGLRPLPLPLQRHSDPADAADHGRGQNLQGDALDGARAEHDLDVNVKAEEEIEVILEHLEYQNHVPMRMVEKLGVDVATVASNSAAAKSTATKSTATKSTATKTAATRAAPKKKA